MHYKFIITVCFFACNFFYSQNKKNSIIKSSDIREITILGNDPVSEKYSVSKLKPLDIYLNPTSNADPLKATTALVYSTNSDESANPQLRGADADRTRVVINGAPIINPVRSGQDIGLGNFSLFNTELIDKLYVYASNPPLTYGNTSAGLVEIETTKKLPSENVQIALALSNVGILINKKINKSSFLQAYGNLQSSEIFYSLNKKNLPNLKDFSSKDTGFNLRINLTDQIYWNSYNYFIDEGYNSNNYMFNFSGETSAKQKRFFSINTLDYKNRGSNMRFVNAIDYSNKLYMFGNINSKSNYIKYFSSLFYKYKFNYHLTIQSGIDLDITQYNYNETLPIHFYLLENLTNVYFNKEKKNFNHYNLYIYSTYNLNKNLGFASSVRKNISLNDNEKNFTSYQFSTNYKPNSKSNLLMSIGKYHSYSTPNFYNHQSNIFSSFQVELDYSLNMKKIQLSGAIYYKKDSGMNQTSYIDKSDHLKTLGAEISSSFNITRKLSFKLSNIYISQNLFIDQKKYNSKLNLNYFIKSQLIYNNPRLFSASLSLSCHPGNNYTPIIVASYDDLINNYIPIFGNINKENFTSYNKLDFTINKIFPIKKDGLIVFLSINNIFNTKNQSAIFYNTDYTKHYFKNYQQRIIYFGVQFRINSLFL